MIAKRALWIMMAAVAIAAIGLIFVSPFPWLMLRLVMEDVHPAMISWDGKTAWKRCESAIAGQTSWPARPTAACAAMYLCVNEAPLSEPQRQQLSAAMRATPGCQDP
jgi:hypothetical protein